MGIFDKLLDKNDQMEVQDVHEQTPEERGNNFFFCLRAKDYFNAEQQQIFQRIKAALFLKPSFKLIIDNKPDLYGPFWIATTLIIIIIASSSLITLFSSANDTYDFTQISVASSLIYGIAFGCPYIIAIIMKIFGSTLEVVNLICIYGYSLTIFLPITMFLFINSDIIQIILLIIGYIMSTFFLIRGILRYEHYYFSMDRSLGEKQKMVLGIFIMGVQFVLILMYKFYFFKII